MDFENQKRHASHGSGQFKVEAFKEIGENVIFEVGVLVFHPEQIRIGKNVYIGHRTILKGYYQNEIVIGDHTWIGQNCFFHGAGGIRIGKGVGIGPTVQILTSMHRSEDLTKPVLAHPLEFKEVVIEDGSDIGIGSIILPGIRVGEGAIVGAGSVVTKEVPPFCIVAGNPAKFLRKRGASELGASEDRHR